MTVDTTTPRCGCCFAPADPYNSDEGYSNCCNDRIEYPAEYLDDPDFRAAVADGRVTR